MNDQTVDAPPVTLTRAELNEEKKVKRLTAIVLFLLLLLGLLLLFYIMFYRVKAEAPKGVSWVLSIYNLKAPHGVATDSERNAYISDTGNHRYLVFDSNGKFVKEIGKRGKKDAFYQPYGSYIDSKEKKIYICDWTARKVVVTSLAGKRLSTFPDDPSVKDYGPKGFSPFQIAEYKGELYVTSKNGIFIFDKKGKLKRKWAQRGKKPGEYAFPNGIAIDQKTGNVFVADVLNRRVVSLTNKGELRWILGKPDKLRKAKRGTERVGTLVSFFQLPRSIAIGPDNNLYITDTFANQIIILDQEGNLIGGVGKRGVNDGEFNFPEGIAFRDDGVAYIADRVNNRVQAIEFSEPYPKLDGDKKKQHKAQLRKF